MNTTSRSLIQKIIIPKINDDCQLCFSQTPDHIPFTIQRVYFISQSLKDKSRGYHAHHQTNQLLFCIQGSIQMTFDDGYQRQSITLNQPEVGVMIPPKIWHEMHNFQADTILLVLASEKYDPQDYIRDYQEFLQIINHAKY